MTTSYHLVIGGSLLQSFSLFMLSLCKQEQLYGVRFHSGSSSATDFQQFSDIPSTRPRRRLRSQHDICSHCRRRLALLPEAMRARDVCCHRGLVNRRYCAPNHAQQYPAQPPGLRKRRSHECRARQQAPPQCVFANAASFLTARHGPAIVENLGTLLT